MTKDLAAKENKNRQFEAFFPPNPDSSRLLVGCAQGDYSASRIAHAVEDADASLINLNVTSLESQAAQIVVALRVDHRDPDRVARSLERYGYEVADTDRSELADDPVLQSRLNELLHYLEF